MSKFIVIGERISVTAPSINRAFNEKDPEPITDKSKTAAGCWCLLSGC